MARFFRRGTTKIFWETVSATPTLVQITGGVALTPAIAGITGFDLTNAPIATPDLSTTFDTQIGGPDTSQASSLEFYDDAASTTIRAALAKGTAGFVVRCPYGAASSSRAEIFPSVSTGVNDVYALTADAAKFMVTFAITGTPNLGYSIP